ncbi:MAG: SRPBCC family protein [Bacteroidota bacterium]|nr:SRPBCC family protein [Bacteroidota bacterium]
MPKILLETYIEAPIERVFDLSMSIDLHKLSTKGTNEEAIAGKTSGLIGLHETVTWHAKHFGIYQKLTVQITKVDRPDVFEDRMLKGTFASMHHVHSFEKEGSGTKMKDVFEFESPLGFLGKFANSLFLKKYMTKLLRGRNAELKRIAEGEEWRELEGMAVSL